MDDTTEKNKNKIIELMQNINEKEDIIRDCNIKIRETDKLIQSYKQQLWDSCEHRWVRDYFTSFDDLCKYSCNICGLWRDRSIYFN